MTADRIDPPARGHRLVRKGPSAWSCACGRSLGGSAWGSGKDSARHLMHFHRVDLKRRKSDKPTVVIVRDKVYSDLLDAAMDYRGVSLASLIAYSEEAVR